MKFDEVVKDLGEFGPYQRRVCFLVYLAAIPQCFQVLGIVFTMATPEHRCLLMNVANDTYQVQSHWHQQMIGRWIPDDAWQLKSSCSMYAEDSATGKPTNVTKICSRFVYDRSTFETTFTEKAGMVCEKKSYTTYANMVFMSGMMAGSFVFGLLADVFGRKPILMITILGHTASSFAVIFITTFIPFLAIRFLAAFFGIGLFLVAFVIGMEIVGTKTRKLAGIVIELFWTAGMLSCVFLAYFIRDWKRLSIAFAVPNVALFIFFFLIPESPRWLLLKGRNKEALAIIQKAARANQVILSPSALSSMEHDQRMEEVEKASLWQMFSTKYLLVLTLVQIYYWHICSLVYYGLTLNVSSLSGNIYLNFTLLAVVEMVSYILVIFILDKVGRKPIMCANMLLAGVTCLATMFPVLFGGKGVAWLTQVLSLTGKFGVSISFAVAFVYTSEVFPTALRNSGLGMCSLSARVGGILAPYVADLGKVVPGPMGIVLPLVVFGGAALLAGILALLLPETTNRALPENVSDARAFGRNSNMKTPCVENNMVLKSRKTSNDKDEHFGKEIRKQSHRVFGRKKMSRSRTDPDNK